jgi:hypothetical protein
MILTRLEVLERLISTLIFGEIELPLLQGVTAKNIAICHVATVVIIVATCPDSHLPKPKRGSG